MAAESEALPDSYGNPTGHELLKVFASRGLPLNPTLVEMLNEHFSHRTERRGSGFTQATRHLAVLANLPPARRKDAAIRLFPDAIGSWRSGAPESATYLRHSEPTSRTELSTLDVLLLRRALHALCDDLELEESRLLAALIADIVLPAPPGDGITQLPYYPEQLKVGTCPLAEKYFLEIADKFVRRKGRANVVVSDAGEPLLLEKVNLGDDHSCISVAPLVLNGVHLPPGCLFGVRYAESAVLRANRELPGEIVPAGSCSGFRFLRFTTLAVSPENRSRAFTTHFESQLEAGLFAPGETTIEQLRRVAEDQV